MKVNKILSVILAMAMILGTMGTVAFADEIGDVAAEGDTVTLLYSTNEDVTFAAGVTLDKQEYEAPGVLSAVAKIGDVSYGTFADALAAANSSTEKPVTINLLGNTISLAGTFGEYKINDDITITNGTFDITGAHAQANAIFYAEGTDVNIAFTNVDFVGDGYSSAFGVIYVNAGAVATLTNCDFTLKNEQFTKGAVLKGNTVAQSSFIIDNCTFELENVVSVIKGATVDIDNTKIKAATTGTGEGYVVGELINHAFRNLVGTVTNSNIAVSGFETGMKNDAGDLTINGASVVKLENSATVDLLVTGNKKVTVAETAKLYADTTSIAEGSTVERNVVAKIGDVYYKTFADAIEAAKASTEAVEITLLTDVEASSIEKSTHATFSNAITINLNGHTYKVVETPNYLYADITFKNGTVEIEEGMYNAQAFFQLYNDGMTLTFDNVTLKANNYTSKGGFINVNASDADGVFVDSVVELSDEKSGGFIKVNGKRSTNEIKIIGTEMNLTDVDVAFTNAMITITDNDTTNKRSLIKITGTKENGVTKAINNAASITVDDSDVIITGATEYGIAHNGDFGPLSLTGTARVIVKDTISKVDIARSKYTPDNVQSKIKVADTAVLEAGYINISAEDITGPVVSKADEINLEFRGVEKTNNREWEIWITGENAETINKMKSAHFVFDNKNKALDYTVEASEGISIVGDIDNEDKMAFYINTLDSVVYPTVDDITNAKTAAEIKLGKVTFDGYGTIDFGVTNDAKVNATTISDSIVETFIPNGTAYKLDITSPEAFIKNAEIVEATRNLNVKLSFNNDVAKTNDACYNDMTVTVTGTNGYIKTGKIGRKCAEAPADVYAKVGDDNVATLVFTGENALPAGYRYTVKVEGAGYRTAEYTTVVGADSTDDVTLTFWNNVKDEFNKTEIESGSDRWYTKNFLAGEIVQDNKINKYDLAAVVSYFGEDNLVENRPDYNKYDLNRDGVIDSEDIAYVLVSFGE